MPPQLTSLYTYLRACFARGPQSLPEPATITASPADATAMASTVLTEFVRDRRRERRWSTFRRALTTAFVVGSLGLSSYATLAITGSLPLFSGSDVTAAANDTVALVNVKGPISADNPQGSAEAIIPALRRAFADSRINVVVLRIDSPGGSPVESERINSELERLRKQTSKQVEAVIDNIGASAAFMIAVHADRITAGRYSLVGSVGAIMHLWDASALAEKIGVFQQTYASGALKDFGNPTRTPSPAELAKGQALVGGLGAIFGEEVIAARGNRLHMERAALTTGEAWSGVEAQRLGLVDDLGTVESVLARYDARGRDFGPGVRKGMGGLFAAWAGGVGSAFAGGVASRLQADARSAQVGE